MATLLQLRQRISYRLDQPLTANDIPASGVFWTKAEVNDWINQVYFELYSDIASIEPPTLVTETSGTYTASARSVSLQTLLSITDDPLKLEEVRDVTGVSSTSAGVLLPYKQHQEFRTSFWGLEQGLRRGFNTGTAWTWYGASPMYISLYPVPSTALTLRIRYVPSTPTALSADANKPVAIPTAHHGAIVSGVVVLAKLKEEDPSWRDDAAEYERRRERLMEAVEQRQVQQGRMPIITDPSERAGWLGGGGSSW